MEEKIIERLKSIKDKGAIILFYNLLREFLTRLGIDQDNPKVSINLRADYRQKFSVNLNSRIVLGLAYSKGQYEILFMIDESDLAIIEVKYALMTKEVFQDKSDKHPAFLIGINVKDLATNDQAVVTECWLKSCIEYEPLQGKSQYRKSNLPLLYELAQRPDLLDSYLEKPAMNESGKQYHEYQKRVFDWLMEMNRSNPDFCFSTRIKNSRGSEKNYFIGTEKSKYFGTTFWFIPCGYPGSSGDLMDIIFTIKGNEYNALLQVYQTRTPGDDQNRLALEFIRALKPQLIKVFPQLSDNEPDHKMEKYTVPLAKENFTAVDTLLLDCKPFIDKMLAVIDQFLVEFKATHPEFIARRINNELFQTKYISRLQSRLKFLSTNTQEEPEGDDEVDQEVMNLVGNVALNTILYGPPGTGKTYYTINKALEIADRTFYEKNKDNRVALLTRFEELRYNPELEIGQIAFVTFHQAMSYEDFIEGIKPVLDKVRISDQVQYDVCPGIFKMICTTAQTKESNFNEKIEWLKQACSEAENKKPIEIKSSKSKFTISYRNGRTFKVKPANSKNLNAEYDASIENIRKVYEGATRKEVYNPTYTVGILEYLYKNGLTKYSEIIEKGEKNYILIIDEINRGNVANIFGELITLIEEDKRLGRPEQLKAILPYSKEEFGVPHNLYIIGTMNTADRSVEALDTALRRRFSFVEMKPNYDLDPLDREIIQGITSSRILKVINARIEKLLDKDHMIGHSYFLTVTETDDLKHAFQNKIIPLLQEYFYGDFGKIGLVLGDGFVKQVKHMGAGKVFADFEDYDEIFDLEERKVYQLVDLGAMSSEDFIKAVNGIFNKGDGKAEPA
jgi:5-methylcytosine-specific restriction protein B